MLDRGCSFFMKLTAFALTFLSKTASSDVDKSSGVLDVDKSEMAADRTSVVEEVGNAEVDE